MRRDKSIFDKYLNMEIKDTNTIIDFKVKFVSKFQKIGVIIFGIGLILLCSGLLILVLRNINNEKKKNEPGVIVNANVKDFKGATSEDGVISLEPFKVIYKKDTGLSDINFIIYFNQDVDEYPVKIIFKLDGKEVVIADYFEGVSLGDSVNSTKQSEYDLTQASEYRIEKTTKEDLVNNYGFSF